jgi:biotin carboxyl carrier protein
MTKSYTARINGNEYRIERNDLGELRVNDVPLDTERFGVADGTLFRFNQKSFTAHAALTPDTDQHFQVTVNGRGIVVELEDEKSALLKAYQSDKATQLHSAIVRSPMPGKITHSLVSEGELIEAGQGVVILEAMKMENEIKAPSAGIVKAVRVQEADAVEKNAILIEIS